MEWNPEVVRRVRGAMQDRARSQACLFKAFSSVMTREQAEALAREGIAEYGRIRAERDGRKLAPEDWMNVHHDGRRIRDGNFRHRRILRNEDALLPPPRRMEKDGAFS